MSDIKIYVCCHKPFTVPQCDILVPMQVGAALAENHFNGFIYDDTLDNISQKNKSYCELTALYWMWKNTSHDYYGLFHYRRYLYPDLKEKLPYTLSNKKSTEELEKLGYGNFKEFISQYDMIMPKGENMHVSVRNHYKNAPFHHIEDLELTEKIIDEYYPDYSKAKDEYLSQQSIYFGNIFIMKKDVFMDYCNFLFSVLKKFDSKSDTSSYGEQEKRVDGYLGERLLGIYYTKRKNELKTIEIPRVHFQSGSSYIKQIALNTILPPGSEIRAKFKKIKNG